MIKTVGDELEKETQRLIVINVCSYLIKILSKLYCDFPFISEKLNNAAIPASKSELNCNLLKKDIEN